MPFELIMLAVGDKGSGGDAIALRFLWRDRQVVMVIDGGTRASGEELVRTIPYYFGTNEVDVAICTHPDADHTSGLIVLLSKLKVHQLAMHLPWQRQDLADMFKDRRLTNRSVGLKLQASLDAACELAHLADEKRVPVLEPFAGIHGFDRAVQILGPSRALYDSLVRRFRDMPERAEDPRAAALSLLARQFDGTELALLRSGRSFALPQDNRGVLRGERRFGVDSGLDVLAEGLLGARRFAPPRRTSAENDTSVITFLNIDGHGLLFTGDAGVDALSGAAAVLRDQGLSHHSIHFIQVPHHGSEYNVNEPVLDLLVGPPQLRGMSSKTAFCSSPTSSPDHPSEKTLNAFRRRGVAVATTQGRRLWYGKGVVPPDDFNVPI